MTGCDHVRPDIGGYVLDALEPAETEAVREHLSRCSECAAEHARLAGLPALLSLAEHLEDAPPLAPAVEERVLDAVARERPRSRGRRRLPALRRPLVVAAATAAVAAAAALAIVVFAGGGDSGGYRLRLQAVSGMAGAGRAELSSEPSGTTVKLWLRDLPPDPDVVYEVQCDAPGWTATAGTFRADTRGRAVVVLTTAMRRGEYDAIRVVRRSRSKTTDVLTASLH
jgi:hypothetical protein